MMFTFYKPRTGKYFLYLNILDTSTQANYIFLISFSLHMHTCVERTPCHNARISQT